MLTEGLMSHCHQSSSGKVMMSSAAISPYSFNQVL